MKYVERVYQKSDWKAYTNGNYVVNIDLNSGTKIKATIDPKEDVFKADFPDSMDIKISNRCPNNCPMCHENSTPDGQLGSILMWYNELYNKGGFLYGI